MREQGPRIYTLAIRLTASETDGADLAQETFVKAWEHWAEFRGDAEAGTWLYRICVNVWKNRVRYEKRRSFWKHVSLNGTPKDDDDRVLELADGAPPLESGLEKTQEQQQLQKALSSLDPEDRALLVLREVDDLPYEEIAATLRVPLGTVKSRLARVRDKLAQEFSRITS